MRNKSWDRLDSVRPGLLRGPMPETRSITDENVEEEICRVICLYGSAYVSKYGFVTPYSSINLLKVCGPYFEIERVVRYMLPFDAKPWWTKD